MIYILTGSIRSGKTLTLKKWMQHKVFVDGVLCPDNEDGKRFFLELKTKKHYMLEAESETVKNTIAVGPFVFLKKAFDAANRYLIKAANASTADYLIIDELGKLELKNKGLHKAAETLILKYQNQPDKHLILVIRDTLLEAIIAHYSIGDFKLVYKLDFENAVL